MPLLVARRANEGRFMIHLMNLYAGRIALSCIALFGIAADSACDADDLPKLSGIEVCDLAGQEYSLGDAADAKVTVLLFLGTQCPVSNGYAPALKRLSAEYATAGVRFLGVHCDPAVSAQAARAHAQEYDLPFRLVLDHEQRLAQACEVKIVPTAVVIRGDGRMLYRGRIDNRFVASGVRRPEATVFDLKDALESAVAGRQPNPSTTDPVGCPLPLVRR